VVTARRERGFALVGALLLLVLLGAAIGLVSESVAVRGRAVVHEAGSLQVAASLDAALAEALAALYVQPNFPGAPARDFAGGWIASEVLRLDPRHVEVTVRAGLRRHRGAAAAVVWVGPGGPRVLSWRRTAPQ
jgi:type II secretory pathway component PulK